MGLQFAFDVVVGFSLFLLITRMMKPAKDDPRLSRGLQILQSKIAILEDLSERTEHQSRQIMSLLDQKNLDIQIQIEKAKEQIRNIEASMQSSLEVAKIFQDKIPHQEIIERQNTIKYLKAALLAHQGGAVEAIAESVGLPLNEVEFIAKVNRDHLNFEPKDLPEWAKQELQYLLPKEIITFKEAPVTTAQIAPLAAEYQFVEESLNEESVIDLGTSEIEEEHFAEVRPHLDTLMQTQESINQVETQFSDQIVKEKPIIRKVIFPVIQSTRDLK